DSTDATGRYRALGTGFLCRVDLLSLPGDRARAAQISAAGRILSRVVESGAAAYPFLRAILRTPLICGRLGIAAKTTEASVARSRALPRGWTSNFSLAHSPKSCARCLGVIDKHGRSVVW